MLFTKWSLEKKVTVLLLSGLHAVVLRRPWRRSEQLVQYLARFPQVQSCSKPCLPAPQSLPDAGGLSCGMRQEVMTSSRKLATGCLVLSSKYKPVPKSSGAQSRGSAVWDPIIHPAVKGFSDIGTLSIFPLPQQGTVPDVENRAAQTCTACPVVVGNIMDTEVGLWLPHKPRGPHRIEP